MRQSRNIYKVLQKKGAVGNDPSWAIGFFVGTNSMCDITTGKLSI